MAVKRRERFWHAQNGVRYNYTHTLCSKSKNENDCRQIRLKIIGKEFPKNCYKTIFRKINTEEIFSQLTLITNKDYFSRKKLKLRKFTVAVYVILSMVVTSLIGANCECL